MSAPDLSVIVVSHNGREMALETLRSARAGAGPVAVEWIVADSGSTDGTPEAIERELPGIAVHRCENRGFAHANNVALRAARGRYVLLLNPDVEIDRGTLADLVAVLDLRPEIGAASVVQRDGNGRLLPSIRRFPSPLRDLGEALMLPRFRLLQGVGELDVAFDRYGEDRSVDWVSGAFLIARREALERVGGLDERFFLYSEEIDWCYRIRQGGWEVRHLPIMEITHHCGPSSPERVAELARSRVLFARKSFGPLRAAAIRLALLLGHLLRVVVIAPWSLVAPGHRDRVRAEAMGLAVLAGVLRPPLSARARADVRRSRDQRVRPIAP